MGDRQRELAQHVPGVLGHQRGAEDPVAPLLEVQTQKTLLGAVQQRPVHLLERQGEGLHLEAPLASVLLVHADVGDLGAGVGAPGHHQVAGLGAAEEERVLDGDARQRVGGVGELVAAGDIADREDAPVGGAKAIVHGDSLPIELDARLLQTDPFHVRGPADRHQQLVDDHAPALPLALEVDHPALGSRLHLENLYAEL